MPRQPYSLFRMKRPKAITVVAVRGRTVIHSFAGLTWFQTSAFPLARRTPGNSAAAGGLVGWDGFIPLRIVLFSRFHPTESHPQDSPKAGVGATPSPAFFIPAPFGAVTTRGACRPDTETAGLERDTATDRNRVSPPAGLFRPATNPGLLVPQ